MTLPAGRHVRYVNDVAEMVVSDGKRVDWRGPGNKGRRRLSRMAVVVVLRGVGGVKRLSKTRFTQFTKCSGRCGWRYTAKWGRRIRSTFPERKVCRGSPFSLMTYGIGLRWERRSSQRWSAGVLYALGHGTSQRSNGSALGTPQPFPETNQYPTRQRTPIAPSSIPTTPP